MKLSTRGRYGTRVMLELTKKYGEGPVSVAQISKSQDIPVKYLEQIIIPLKKANLINSIRGPKGGHMLAVPPEKINIWDVLVLLESKLTFVDCLGDGKACGHSGECPIRPVWGRAFDAVVKIFRETSLQDVLDLKGSEAHRKKSKPRKK
jgi:Rrf2 family protein